MTSWLKSQPRSRFRALYYWLRRRPEPCKFGAEPMRERPARLPSPSTRMPHMLYRPRRPRVPRSGSCTRELSMPGPLAGLRVLELARILAGPWAGQLLADLGADVVKVERKGTGDDTRGWGPPFVEAADGNHLGAAYFHATNRGKRSIELDFESEDGRRIVKKLAARSDVLIENFKVGGLAKFGLDYASLAPDNPRLIYCSVTGFGQTGPNAQRPGYDLMAQGMGGMMDLTGNPDGEPMRAGAAGKDRPRRPCRYRADRHHGRHPRQPGAQLSDLRQAAEAHGQRASER